MDNQSKELITQAINYCDTLKEYKIETPSKYELASADLKTAKDMLKQVDGKEKEITKPINEGLKNARAFFKPAKDRLNSIITKINREMSIFRRNQEQEAEKKKAEMAKEAGDGDVFVPEVTPEIPKTEVKVRKNWKFRVIDKASIDPKFLIPDEKTIGELVRKLQAKAVEVVGGIEVYVEETSY